MPSFLPRKAKPTLSVSEMALGTEARNKAIFDGWLDECVSLEEAWIEIKLANLPAVQRG